MLHEEGVGGMLASLVENCNSTILRSNEATISIANCISAMAAKSNHIATQLVNCGCVLALVRFLEKHPSVHTEFYITQAIRILCHCSAGARALREPTIVASMVRHFKSNYCRASTRYQLALTLMQLGNEQLAQRGIRR